MVASYQAKYSEPKRELYPHTGEFMSKSFVTVSPDMDIYKAIEILLKHKISGAAVVDENENMVGFISEKDCLSLVAHDTYDNVLPGGKVSKYMSKGVKTLTVETGLNMVADIFMHTPYRKLPVLDEQGKLVGMVRRRDVLSVIQELSSKQTEFMSSQH